MFKVAYQVVMDVAVIHPTRPPTVKVTATAIRISGKGERTGHLDGVRMLIGMWRWCLLGLYSSINACDREEK